MPGAKVLGKPQLADDLAGRQVALKPWWPVEQKRQPTAQPACEDMHSVPGHPRG
jgi:hypothetical protein